MSLILQRLEAPREGGKLVGAEHPPEAAGRRNGRKNCKRGDWETGSDWNVNKKEFRLSKPCESKSLSSVPPWALLQFLPPASYIEFPFSLPPDDEL